jgi:glycosyltransferase involved in cell wall biosynthesis
MGMRLAGRHYPRDSITLRASLPLSYSFWMRRLDLCPDVIETQDGETRGLLQALRRTRPLVIHLHCPTMHAIRLSGERLGVKGLLADRLDRMSSDLADGVTSPSQLLIDTLRDIGWLNHRDVEIIPNPFDAQPWQDVPSAVHTEPTVVAVGRLEVHKGIDVLLEASSRLLTAGVRHKVVLAGRSAGLIDGTPSGQWLANRARELGVDCVFTGHLPAGRLAAVYAQARVVAVPSRFESFSIAATEAMAAGRPVVTTTRTGVAMYVKSWEAGSVVPPGEPGHLADALAPFLVDPAQAAAIGKNGRAGVTELDPVVIARRKEAAYLRAIESFHARHTRLPLDI